MTWLLPPTTFAEGQRALMVWLIAAAGMFAGVAICALIAILVWGGWADEHQRLILMILAGALFGFVVAMSLVIGGFLIGGPVGKFSLHASKTGVGIDMEDQQVREPSAGAAAAAAAVAVTDPPQDRGEG